MRSNFEFTGDSLFENATSLESVLSNEQITQNISNLHQIADIDDNGKVDALTDALTLLRYLFEFRGESLVNDAVALDANRININEIESYIEAHMP